MNIRRRHWLVAIIVAVLAHASMILLLWEPKESGAANLGVGGMEISFGMAGGAPGAAAVAPPEAKTVDAPEKDVIEPIQPPPVESAEVTEPLEAAEQPEPVEVETVEPQSAAAVPIAEVKPKTETAKVPTKPAPPRDVKPEVVKPVEAVEPEPAPEAAASKEVASTEPLQEKPSTEAPTVAGSGGKSGTQESANVGSGESTSSGGRPGSADSYFARLQAWLEQHKEYPSSARRRRQEGTAVLTFTMNRDGDVLVAHIRRGTGHKALDDEVIKMIERAAPLPALPDDFTQRELTLSVPVQFQLH